MNADRHEECMENTESVSLLNHYDMFFACSNDAYSKPAILLDQYSFFLVEKNKMN